MFTPLVSSLRPWLLAAVLLACAPDRALSELPEAQALAAARPTLTVDGLEVALTVDVVRHVLAELPDDGCASRGHRLLVGARLTPVRTAELNGLPLLLPKGMAIERLFVVRGDRVWVTGVETRDRQTDDLLQVHARGGPAWDPGMPVDVYAEVGLPGAPPIYVVSKGEPIVAMF